jgi:phospholipid/cholesterol/gamma-HCH transport system substrate-binding protein
MKAAQTKRTTIVGIFIFTGILIFISGVLVLGGQKKTFKKTVTVNAIFNDVNGLLDGNNVWFSGVKVGTVKKMGLTDSARVAVEMKIEKQSQHLIRKDARAKIASDGLIGNKIVIIYGGTYETPAVKSGDTLFVEKPLNTEAMMNTLQESNKNLLAITGNFKLISDRLADGQGTIGKLLSNDTMANHLQSTAVTLKEASANIQMLTSDLADYSSKLQTKGALANELVTDTSFFKTLKAASLQIQEASLNAKELTGNLKDVSYKLKDSNNLAGVAFHDMQAADNLRLTVENFRSGAEKFNENMEALQHNFLFRGFFRRRAKQQKQQQAQQQPLSLQTR